MKKNKDEYEKNEKLDLELIKENSSKIIIKKDNKKIDSFEII